MYLYADVMIQNCGGTVLSRQKGKGGVGMGSWSPDEKLKTAKGHPDPGQRKGSP